MSIGCWYIIDTSVRRADSIPARDAEHHLGARRDHHEPCREVQKDEVLGLRQHDEEEAEADEADCADFSSVAACAAFVVFTSAAGFFAAAGAGEVGAGVI